MNIGIVTFQDENYGNRLQNYATQEVLKSINSIPKTIKVTDELFDLYKQQWIITLWQKIKSKRFNDYIKFFLRKMNLINTDKEKQEQRGRTNLFCEFSKKYIDYADFELPVSCFQSGRLKEYDFFVCGSDQIWNPYFFRSSLYFLTFTEYDKSIAYSASFGVNSLPNEVKDAYRKWLNGIKYISVREEQGANIVQDLIERKAEVLVDPTLMLTKNEWTKIEKKPLFSIKKGYILVYFLGRKDKKTVKYIQQLKRETGLNVINLDTYDRNKYWYLTGPMEFIWLIKNCSLVCTDSFHGTVFSIIMKKPFLVFNRKNSKNRAMHSRIDTLLSKFKLEDRRFCNQHGDEIFRCEYDNIDTIIEKEKKKTINFLKNAMELE